MGVVTISIYLVLALVSALVFYIKRHYSYWKRRGIPHNEPDIPEGNMKGFMKTRHFREIMTEYYHKFKHSGPFGGFFFFVTPVVVIFDLDLVKNILIRDFNNFSDRLMFYNVRDDPLSGHLFSLDGVKWKNLRNKLSPTFTSGKMKYMFPNLVSVAEQLQEVVSNMVDEDSIIEVKDILARFTVDVIGSSAFGIDCNSLKDPSAEFRIQGRKVFTHHRHNSLIEGFMYSCPKLARKLRMKITHEEVEKFFMRVVRDTVEYREKNNVKRNDFMNLLIEIKNSEDGITFEELAAQAFIFFVAGFETSSTTMSFALFELAINQDVQDKVRAEINEKLKKYNGEFTYECMTEMHYLEKVIKETLRKYFIIGSLSRVALDDYPTSDPKYTIPKGMMVIIPADAIHRDPEIYPDPERFDPERFSPEEMQKRHSSTWLPFGDGPRNCIGLRFGKMQTYTGLVMLLTKYKFHYCDKTPNPLEYDPTNSILATKGGIYLRVERLE